MRPRRNLLLGITCASALALAALAPRAALAAPTDGEKLFREGRTALQNNDLETACARFAESQRVEPAPGTALNLGDCEERRGHLMAARGAFLIASAAFATADKKQYATSRAEGVEKRIPRLLVNVSGAPADLVVLRVGDRAVSAASEVRHDPGEVVITAEAKGYRPRTMRAVLKEGQTLELDIGPLEAESATGSASRDKTPQAGATPLALPPRREESNTGRTLGWTFAGVGAASLTVGVLTGIMTLGKASTVEEHCDGDLACDSEGLDAASAGKTLSLVSTITVIAGVLGLGAGTYLLLTTPSSTTNRGTAAPLRLTPIANRDVVGLELGKRF
jgi:hypothetical protein